MLNFVDFRKAIDSIHKPSMQKLLKLYDIHNEIVSLIKSMFEGSESCVSCRVEPCRPGSTRIKNIWSKRNISCSVSNMRCFDFLNDCGKKLSTASSLCVARNDQKRTVFVPYAISIKSIVVQILQFSKVPYYCGKKLSTQALSASLSVARNKAFKKSTYNQVGLFSI